MALILKRLSQLFDYAVNDLPDPRTKTWSLVFSVKELLCTVAIYLIMVDLLPKFMEKRKPYKLKNVMIVYNIFQMLASIYFLIAGFPIIIKQSIFCSQVDTSDTPEAIKLANLVWCYYILKIIDLLDTVFFILRKKQNQVTFLHVYHHFGMVFFSWVGIKYIPGGHSTYLGYVNSIVHVCMYGYYLLALVNAKNKYLPQIKKYVTQMQLMQFMVLAFVYSFPLCNMECTFPKFVLLAYIPQNFIMLVMFGDFYYKTYIKKKPQH